MIVVYLVEDPTKYMELTSSLKLICEELGFSYNTLSRKTYPFEFRGYRFEDKDPKLYTRTNKG
jgi:hypothetical protein